LAKIHERQIVAHGSALVASGERIIVPKLSVVVATPALHRTIFEEGTRGIPSRRERNRSGNVAKVEIRERIAHLVGILASIVRVKEAELSLIIASPAFHLAIL